jgi:hypothetical protein
MSGLQMAVSFTIVLNLLWFGMAFNYFSLKSTSAAKMLIYKPLRDSPLFKTTAYSVQFLGGMNFALAILSLLMLLNPANFNSTQMAWLMIVVAVAHASQFVFNIPLALLKDSLAGNDKPGLNSPLRFIFIVDGTLMIANALLAAILFAK